MALFSIEGKEMDYMPHVESYDRYRSSLNEDDYSSIISELHSIMNAHATRNKPFNSSHIPGSMWKGTPWMPIYLACGEDEGESGKFFGQLVWKAVMNHPDRWYFKKEERDDDRPGGTIYWRAQDQ